MPLYSDTSFENPDEVLNPAIALTLTDEIFNNESRPSVQKRAEAELSIRLAGRRPYWRLRRSSS